MKRHLAALALAWCLPAAAGYFQWDMVELPPSSGATCGNGTPFRFFVNRTPLSKNTVIVYEGGGACWDQKACLGEGARSAKNPNGVPPDYMKSIDVANGLVTPFSSRGGAFQKVQTQSWNIVFVPYCTGDVHSGSKVRVYDDAYPDNPRVQHHAGQANARAAAQWLRANLGQPKDLLLTGFSAGGVGATTTYGIVRDALQPTGKVSLLADSGPLMPAPRSGAPEQYRSLPLHERIREAWGLDEPGGLIPLYNATLPAFDANDLGSLSGALAQRYPDDRLGFMLFQADSNFSAFSYNKFWPETIDDRSVRLAYWQQDIANWFPTLAQHANIALHVPFFRNFNESHCLTIIDFSGTGIQEAGIADLSTFVDNTLDRGAPMRTFENDRISDYFVPLSDAIRLFKLLDILL